MNIKTMIRLAICGLLLTSQVFAACGEHQTLVDGVCQCENGFVLDDTNNACHHIESSELNVLP